MEIEKKISYNLNFKRKPIVQTKNNFTINYEINSHDLKVERALYKPLTQRFEELLQKSQIMNLEQLLRNLTTYNGTTEEVIREAYRAPVFDRISMLQKEYETQVEIDKTTYKKLMEQQAKINNQNRQKEKRSQSFGNEKTTEKGGEPQETSTT